MGSAIHWEVDKAEEGYTWDDEAWELGLGCNGEREGAARCKEEEDSRNFFLSSARDFDALLTS